MLFVWAMVAAIFVVMPTAHAAGFGTEPVPAPAASDSPIVSLADDVEPLAESAPVNVMGKLADALHDAAFEPQKGYVAVVIHTTNVPSLGVVLEGVGAKMTAVIDGQPREAKFVARPWGTVGAPSNLFVQVPQTALVGIASLPFVQYVDVPSVHATTQVQDAVWQEERRGFQSWVAKVKQGVTKSPVELTGTDSSASPTSWGIAREHKAWDAWQLGVQGDGVYVAIIDTGEDFGHPSLHGQWATDPNPASPWFGWPIMFHPASMEGLMGGFWTAGSDWDRLPLPYWLSVNDGDSWYTNTDYRANDSNLDGFLRYRHGTADPLTGAFQYTPRYNPQQYGRFGANAQLRIDRDYYIGCAGLPGPCIQSASGIYRLGVHRDDTLTGLWGEKVGILLVDSTTPFVYDTVYVDLNFNLDFTDDKMVTQADPIAVADLTGDGVPDISGGLLYFIAQSTPVTGETVIASITGTETNAFLANGWVATDIDGWFTFQPPVRLWLDDGFFTHYVPGATETLYEEFLGGPGDETGTQWALGGPMTAFGPVNLITFQSVDTATLLRGTPDFAMSLIYDIADGTGTLAAGIDYDINMDTGVITFWKDIADGDVVYIMYQLDTYVVEPVSGELTFFDTLPAGWSLLADYDTGTPIPYSQVWGPSKGYDTFIPANGDLVAFHGEFDNLQSHGSFVASTVAARPFGNLASPFFEVFGTAPSAKIIGIAACCNTPGPLGLFGSIEDQRTFAALGYDGVPNTGDEAVLLSNSFGSTQTINTGFSFQDRWLQDFWTAYPMLTTLIALGNNGPGYGTGAPGGTSSGVIGVGAGTSHDYRILYGFDGGDAYWELPVCPGPPPIDPATCVGFGAASGSGPGPYGDHIYFSSRGPTLLGSPKPDIVSIGGFAVEAGPLNVFSGNPVNLDGNFAFDIFSGTSQATPVTSGVAALIVDAYRQAHGGATPTNDMVKLLLKGGADDMHRDVLQQGAGWTNALRSVEMALEVDGVSASVDHWLPGGYRGVSRPAFVNFLGGGQSDAATVTLTNHHPGIAKTVQIRDSVYGEVAEFRWPFTLATGTGQHYILKADGVYAIDGMTLLQPFTFAPHWNAADFVRVTFAYDARAFTGGTNWRLDIFDWYDDNFDGIYGGFGERNRMTVAVAGANANSIWDTIYYPGARVHDGLVLNPRSGAAAPIPATLIVEFYQKQDWAWITTSAASLLLAAAGGTASFTATATVPAGAGAGIYEGAIYIIDGTDTTTIPVLINVPSTGFPILLGGNVPTTSLYDNNGVVQGSRSTSPWRQTADSRYVWGDITVLPAEGRKMIYNAILQGPRSDAEMFVYQLQADTTWTDDATYGPGTMNLLAKTKEVVGATDTLYPNREFMHSTPFSGLIAFQIKSWNSMDAIEPLEANIGIMQVTPISFNIATNKLADSRPMSVWANVPLYDGLGAAVTESSSSTLTLNNVAAAPNYFPGGSFGGWMCAQRAPNAYALPPVGAVISRNVDVHITSPSGSDDHDLQVYLDENNNGVCDFGIDTLLCQSADADADEQCVASTPDGTKNILIQIGIFQAGSDRFNLVAVDTVLRLGVSAFALSAPTTTIAPNTPVAAGLRWDFPGSTPTGTQIGKLFVSPGYARFALAVETSITWTYDLTPPSIDRSRDLSPVPNSRISDAAASVVANINDAAAQIDRFSVQLLVDGVDVTNTAKVLAPYNSGFPLVTVAWEHPDMPFTDGRHSAVVNVRDFAGNLRTEVWSWVVDTTAPSLAITSPMADLLTNAPAFAFRATTEAGAVVTVTQNGVPVTATVTPEGMISASLTLTEGANDVVVTSVDDLGNTATASRTIVLDTASPVVTAGVDVLSPTNRRSTTVSGSVNERVTAVWVNGMPAGVSADGTFAALVPLAEGSNAITIVTWDGAGNQGSVTLPTVVRDTIAPTISLDALPRVITDFATQTITVSGSVPDADVFFVTVNGQPVARDTTGRFSKTFDLAVGDNVFVVQAQDDAGNSAQSVTSVAYTPTVKREIANYNSIIASGVAIVLLIVGFVVGYLLSGRGGGPAPEAEPAMKEEPTGDSMEESPDDDASKEEEEL